MKLPELIENMTFSKHLDQNCPDQKQMIIELIQKVAPTFKNVSGLRKALTTIPYNSRFLVVIPNELVLSEEETKILIVLFIDRQWVREFDRKHIPRRQSFP